MRSNIPFDTQAFVKKLTAAGAPEPQAEVHAEALGGMVIERLVGVIEGVKFEDGIKVDKFAS